MKFIEALRDHSIKAIRLPIWANEEDRLELPPIINGSRGPWCKCVFSTPIFAADGECKGFEMKETPIGAWEFAKDDSEYETWHPK